MLFAELFEEIIKLRHYQRNSQNKTFITQLNIEIGRYRNIERNQRVCTSCNSVDIEDEYHFILKCSYYIDLREKYIKVYYYKNPSMYKLVQLLSVTNQKELSNLGKYLKAANKRRSAVQPL